MSILVYLDTGDLARLEIGQRTSPHEVTAFFTQWHELDCELALTLHHAMEVAQIETEKMRRQRLDLLSRFKNVRFEGSGSDRVLRMEIETQLVARLNEETADYSRLRHALFSPSSVEVFEQYLKASGDLLRRFRAPIQMGTDARNASRGLKRPFGLKRLQSSSIDLDAVREQMEAALEAEDLEPAARNVMRALFANLSQHLRRTGDVRAAMEASLGLDAVDCVRELSDEELSIVGTFFAIAFEVGEQAAAQTGQTEQLRNVVATLAPFDCPSFRITAALTRGQDDSPKPGEPSDDPDRDHAAFIPYVDVAFVDRRTAGFLEQDARRKGGRLARTDIAHVCRSTSIGKLMDSVKRIVQPMPDATI